MVCDAGGASDRVLCLQSHFAAWIEAEVEPEDIEDLYKEVHASIRADPAPQKKERQEKPEEKKKWKQSKLTYEERKANLKVPSSCDVPTARFVCSVVQL